MSLYELQRNGGHRIAALLTTFSDAHDRVSMHGVRRVLIERQAESIGLPLEKVFVSPCSTNQEYETKMRATLQRHQRQGVSAVASGDIFLEDLRAYREKNLAQIGMKGLFPIWKRNTNELVRAFLSHGFQAVVCCVDAKVLPRSFAGRRIDPAFLADLPQHVDPCGENGEFHSFVYAGPPFREDIRVTVGEVVTRSHFHYCDLLPA